MLNKILLIRPQNIYNYNNYPPLNLICLGAQLKNSGYEVKIINCAFEKDPWLAIRRELKDTLLVGVSLLTSEALDAYKIVKYIKENSDVPVVAGGAHCTLFPDQMANSEYIDYVIEGEGEDHIVRLADAISKGERPDRKVFSKETLDMEKLPPPEYSLDENIERFITGYLTDKLSEYVRQPMRWLPYESSRGCPSKCTFCINIVTKNNLYRKKSASKVLDEIEHIVNKYGLTHLKFIDDNFFVDIARVREICEGMIERGLGVTWDGECRCDYFNDRMINDETLKLLKRSGLVQLTLGIESGSRHTLSLMKKGITPEQAEHSVERCDKYGIIARSSFILEIPGETLVDIKQTIKLMNRLRRYAFFTCGVGTFRPYPRCELTQKLVKEGYLEEPEDFKGWTDRKMIDLYTSAEYIRPWQVNGKYSESACYYLNMESAVRLGNYQINDRMDRLKNSLFMKVAKVRNRTYFYRFPFDKELYKRFLKDFYRKRQDLEKAGSYPVASAEEEVYS
ncbi:MAG: B12-binding domain-containing radical SAM protein [Candidatus Omnitrophica bacterium]|nr:B12-binding domain-containing radical SAM protein [Candidatus Omnitrophota bacterium]